MKEQITIRYIVSGAVNVDKPAGFDTMSDNEKAIWTNDYLESLDSDIILESVIDNARNEAPQTESIEDNENDYEPLIPYTDLWKAYRNEV